MVPCIALMHVFSHSFLIFFYFLIFSVHNILENNFLQIFLIQNFVFLRKKWIFFFHFILYWYVDNIVTFI